MMNVSNKIFPLNKKGKINMKNPEKNGVAKLGYTATMLIVSVAILVCMKKYKEK